MAKPVTKRGFFSRKQQGDQELEEFRALMKPPGSFEDGFSWSSFVGSLFLAGLMVPGAIYMALLLGGSASPPAQWVTVILFIEVARRAHKHVKKAEIFTLFYLAGGVMVTASMAQGGVLWMQFFAQSDAARAAGISQRIPSWVVPSDPGVLEQRSLFMWQWLPAVGLAVFTTIIGRIDNMVLGYGLFRIASDVEKLPFPMAPVGAQGILALSEEQEEEMGARRLRDAEHGGEGLSWRWRVFSIGAVLGIVFGLVYVGIPTITGALLAQPIEILPLPFVDFTQQTGKYLPAVAIGLTFDLSVVIWGMVAPYGAVLGGFAALLITMVLNPVLHLPQFGILKLWHPGDGVQQTFYKNNIDFYFSFQIGIAMAIAVVGIVSVVRSLTTERRKLRAQTQFGKRLAFNIPEGRGDIRPWWVAVTYLGSSMIYICTSAWLLYLADGKVFWPVMWLMLFYAFLYTPVVSYVTARLEGIAGQVLAIPYVREATFILSGYHGVAIWFLPIPMHDYGSMTVFYRECELTGTKFWSIWKSEILLTPIVLMGYLLFAHFIWRLGPIPSPQYPFTMKWWEVSAANQCVVYTSTLGGFTEFEEAFNGSYITAGALIGAAMFGGFAWLGAPTFFIYGIVRGLGTYPYVAVPEFIGALIGRYYFRRRLGLIWRQYIPVVAAGFSCGMGLIGTLGIGFTFASKAVFALPF
jgi:hypothetical protein